MRFLALLLTAITATGQGVVGFSWRASTEPDVIGYRLYHGPRSRDYTNTIIIPGRETVRFSTIVEGTQYFSLTCMASNGVESIFSPELVHLPQIGLVVESSVDLLFWYPVATNAVYSVAPFEAFRVRVNGR